MDLLDVPFKLFSGPEGRLTFIALKKIAGSLMLLHVCLELFFREEGLPAFLAFYFRQGSSIHGVRWWNMNEPSLMEALTDDNHNYYNVLQNNSFSQPFYAILVKKKIIIIYI
jgi:hypothetical protein